MEAQRRGALGAEAGGTHLIVETVPLGVASLTLHLSGFQSCTPAKLQGNAESRALGRTGVASNGQAVSSVGQALRERFLNRGCGMKTTPEKRGLSWALKDILVLTGGGVVMPEGGDGCFTWKMKAQR